MNRARAGFGIALGVVLATMLATPHLASQALPVPAGEATGPDPRVLLSSQGLASASALAPGQLIREIDDPFNGARWLLVRDENCPAGPRRLVLIESGRGELSRSRKFGAATAELASNELATLRPVIRAGDRLVVEENTAVVESRLEAVALGPAAAGGSLEVRLRIGGKVVRAVALAPGRAAFASTGEGRP